MLLDEKGIAVSGGEHRYDDLIHAEQLTGSLPAQAGTCSAPDGHTPEPHGDVAAERMLSTGAPAERHTSRGEWNKCRRALSAALLLLSGQTYAADVHPIIPLWLTAGPVPMHERVRLTKRRAHRLKRPCVDRVSPRAGSASAPQSSWFRQATRSCGWIMKATMAAYADHGIAAFVLKYRLAGEKDLATRSSASLGGSACHSHGTEPIRRLGHDPARIGVIFSGGEVAVGRFALRCGAARRRFREAKLATEFSGAPVSGHPQGLVLAGFPRPLSPWRAEDRSRRSRKAGGLSTSRCARRGACRAASMKVWVMASGCGPAMWVRPPQACGVLNAEAGRLEQRRQ